LIRRKFRRALTKFIRKYKKKEVDIPKALLILKEFQKKRQEKQEEINSLRDTYAMSLLMGKVEDEENNCDNQH